MSSLLGSESPEEFLWNPFETRAIDSLHRPSRLCVLIPAYDEAASIGQVIREIPKEVEGIEEVFVLVIDDGSVDGTHRVAVSHGADHVLRHRVNQGLGVAFRNGLQVALKLGADVIVNIDGDSQYSGRDIPSLVAPIVRNEADVVLGDRQVDTLNHMSWGRRLGNKIATRVVRTLSGVNVPDGQTGFRAFSRDAALRLNLVGRYTHVHEVIIQAAKSGLRIWTVPVSFRKREGESRLIRSMWSYAVKAGSIMLRTYMRYEPLKTFAVAGLGFILLASVFGARVLIQFSPTGPQSVWCVRRYLPHLVGRRHRMVSHGICTARVLSRSPEGSDRRFLNELEWAPVTRALPCRADC